MQKIKLNLFFFILLSQILTASLVSANSNQSFCYHFYGADRGKVKSDLLELLDSGEYSIDFISEKISQLSKEIEQISDRSSLEEYLFFVTSGKGRITEKAAAKEQTITQLKTRFAENFSRWQRFTNFVHRNLNEPKQEIWLNEKELKQMRTHAHDLSQLSSLIRNKIYGFEIVYSEHRSDLPVLPN